MKLIIGLGNPEQRYENTRHNVGFFVVSRYAREQGTKFQAKDKFKADIAELTVNGEKLILVKPTTYYNSSGEAVRAIADFYKIEPSEILVIHDELALPFGTIRTRLGGSDAGNNGVKSINQHLGPDTARIRVGVWNELRDRINDADFVLSNFTSDEQTRLEETLPRLYSLIDSFISGSFETTTHR